AGVWLRTTAVDTDHVWRIGGYAAGGAVLAVAATALALLGPPAPSLGVASAFVLFVSTGTEGSLLGVLVGTFAVTTRQLRREREAAGEYETLLALLRHNLRNRLTVLGGHLTFVAEATGPEAADSVAAIESQLEAVETLLEDARVAAEAIGGSDTAEPVDLVAVVREQVGLLEESHDGVSVTVDLPGRARVRADDLLAPAVENVLSNAVEHHDRPDPEVSVDVEPVDGAVRLSIADDGPGVPAERRADVFEPGTGDGTGMGLFLAKTVVERYGGSIDLGGNDPRGTVVTITLPRASAE
ncbi:MAG: sensor histidine kinase, partial [Halobacteriales archaeon]